jgi:uncharacterized membrane-anchored protein
MKFRVAALLLTLGVGLASGQEPPKVQWLNGPVTAALGDSLAQIRLPAGYGFVAAQDARALLEAMGNPPDGSEVGLVMPQTKSAGWFAIFEYSSVGYVRDDERASLDAAAALESIRKATEADNVEREKRGIPGLHIVRWIDPPNYDVRTHNLQWTVLAKDDSGQEVANYNVRLLGRDGYMSVTLVDEPDRLAQAKADLERLLVEFSYLPGKTYAEYTKGDRVAEVGLVALIAGGAGAAAVKYGLFAKLGAVLVAFGKFIAVGVMAVLGFFARLVGRLFGNRKGEAASTANRTAAPDA